MKEINGEIFARGAEELGKVFGYTKRRINQLLLEEGHPIKHPDGYNTAEWYRWFMDKAKKAKNPYQKVRMLHEEEKMKKTILERKAMEGKLVDREQRNDEEKARMTELTQTFLVLPSRTAGQCYGKDIAEIEAIIYREVVRILKYFEKKCCGEPVKEIKPKRSNAGRKKKIEKVSKTKSSKK